MLIFLASTMLCWIIWLFFCLQKVWRCTRSQNFLLRGLLLFAFRARWNTCLMRLSLLRIPRWCLLGKYMIWLTFAYFAVSLKERRIINRDTLFVLKLGICLNTIMRAHLWCLLRIRIAASVDSEVHRVVGRVCLGVSYSLCSVEYIFEVLLGIYMPLSPLLTLLYLLCFLHIYFKFLTIF